jgi:hypothetical protein
MKGRSRFSDSEAALIRQRLHQLRSAPRERQKVIRSGLRRRGFYITDWDRSGKGFTLVGFDALLGNGRIAIIRV